MKQVRYQRRTGRTTVEFALVVPLIFMFFFAAFEFSRMSMIEHSVELAAYEGARRGVVPGATAADAASTATQVLASVGARNAVVTVTPNPITPQTSQITVDIEVPLDANAWVPPYFLKGFKFDRAFTLGRENVSWGMTSQPPPPPPEQPVISPPPDTTSDNHNSGAGRRGNNDDEDQRDRDRDRDRGRDRDRDRDRDRN